MADVLVLQTQENAPPGLIGAWAAGRGISLDVLRIDRWRELPSPSEYEFAILLGSDETLTAAPKDWIARELEWIGQADAAGVPLLGICFGAQALAVAFGGRVTRLEHPEYAWIEVEPDTGWGIARGPWLALHEDTITTPSGARELVRNSSGVQAFTINGHLGVQFHPEVTPAILSDWLADRGDHGAGVSRELLAEASARCRSAAVGTFALLDGFWQRARVR